MKTPATPRFTEQNKDAWHYEKHETPDGYVIYRVGNLSPDAWEKGYRPHMEFHQAVGRKGARA